MSLPVYKAVQGGVLPMRPRGQLLKGWLPGTIVNFIPSDDGKYMDVDIATKNPHKASNGGCFTMNGSYELSPLFDRRFANLNEPTGFWTPDETIQLSKNEQNFCLQYDDKLQLQKMGKDITTVNYDGGCFKLYVYERFDNEYLESQGKRGKEINWNQHVGQILGTSPRSLFTNYKNNVVDQLPSYRVGKYAKDENGKYYLFIVRR